MIQEILKITGVHTIYDQQTDNYIISKIIDSNKLINFVKDFNINLFNEIMSIIINSNNINDEEEAYDYYIKTIETELNNNNNGIIKLDDDIIKYIIKKRIPNYKPRSKNY